MAILGEDRALSLAQVQATVAPIADYLDERGWRVAGAFDLRERETLRRTLQELVALGCAGRYDGGTETVWRIAPDKHLVAAFYRNTAIHVFVDRAIGELALLAAAESDVGRLRRHCRGRGAAAARAAEVRLLLRRSPRVRRGHRRRAARRRGSRRPDRSQGRHRRATRPAGDDAAARRAPGAATVPRRLPHRRRPARRPRRALQRGRVPRRLHRGGAAVGAAGTDHQRRVGHARAVQDGPAPRRPPRTARPRHPRPRQAARRLRRRDRGRPWPASTTIAEFHRAGRA